MKRPILAILAASIFNFIYGWVSWGMLPWHQPEPFENEDAIVAAIKENTSKHAMYSYPDWSEMQKAEDKDGQQAYLDKWREGPSVYAMVRPGTNTEASMTTGMLSGFLISVLACTVLFILIQRSGQTTLKGRVSVAFLVGLFVAIVSALYPWNWLEYPGLETVATFCDGIIPWTIAGTIMALITPKANPA